MNVTINRAEMLCAIKRASAIAPADSPLDVLRGVLLEADAAAGKLTVTSTNLEAALEEKLPCTVQEDGALVFGAKMLAEMLSRLPQDKGSTRPLGNLANEALRMKRMETHQVFDSFWKERGMSRTQGYKWMAKKLRLSEELAHIGGFEMDRCQKLIRLCEKERNKEKKKETA